MKSIFTLVTFLVLCSNLSAQKPNISEESQAAAAGGPLLTRTTPRVPPIALPKDEDHLYSSFLSRQTRGLRNCC